MLRVARARAPRARVNGARARRRARRSAARRTEATGNGGEHEPPPPPGGVVSFVLCAPEGPLNVGAAARVIQNFSLPSSLRVVRPSASVLRDDDDGASAPRLHEDAYKFAVHAKWMLDDCCARGESVLEAVAEASLVVATTARPRENLPLLTLGAACEKMRDEIARGGKCAILFGNERTGLTNEELELAEFGVSIPTSATVGTSAMARRNKYSGGAGVDGSQTATSLNLGMAVGVVAYELFSQVHEVREDDETKSIGGFNQPHRLTVGERAALIDDVVAARRAVDVFADVDAEEDVIFAEKERRAITAVLSSGPIATRDATPIFMLARRARARPARGPERVSRRRGARVRASQRWRRAEHQISQRVHSRNIRHQSHEARARARRSVGSRRLAALSAAAPSRDGTVHHARRPLVRARRVQREQRVQRVAVERKQASVTPEAPRTGRVFDRDDALQPGEHPPVRGNGVDAPPAARCRRPRDVPEAVGEDADVSARRERHALGVG
jgi:tRNA C32,U32 (ribose-2'-O)-methylase TrmJ